MSEYEKSHAVDNLQFLVFIQWASLIEQVIAEQVDKELPHYLVHLLFRHLGKTFVQLFMLFARVVMYLLVISGVLILIEFIHNSEAGSQKEEIKLLIVPSFLELLSMIAFGLVLCALSHWMSLLWCHGYFLRNILAQLFLLRDCMIIISIRS
jgi:hypothetical protein